MSDVQVAGWLWGLLVGGLGGAAVAVLMDRMARRRESTAARLSEADDRARDQLLESESERRERAERVASRLTRLQAITSSLSTAASSELVAEVIMAEGMKALETDAGTLATIKGDLRTLQVVARQGWDVEGAPSPDEIPLHAPMPIAEAARNRRGVYLESFDELRQRYPHVAETMGGTHHRSWAAIPLVASGRMLGALEAGFTDARPFDTERMAFFEAVAHQCATALDRALSYDAMRVLAQTLQRSLLPPSIPEVDDLDLALRFEPAGNGEVSGDFYDAFALPGGKTWCVTIGDVCGKGPAAAGMTSLARHTIRAAAHHDPRPSTVLTELAEALRRDGEERNGVADEAFCTAVFATMRVRAGGGLVVEIACGGHPLPLHVRACGTVTECGRPGTLLGAFPTSDLVLEDHVMELDAGDSMLLYTDGLTEATGPDGFFGDERARRAASRRVESASTLVTAVVDEALQFSRGVLRDDLAVLVVRAPSPEGP